MKLYEAPGRILHTTDIAFSVWYDDDGYSISAQDQ